MCRPAKRARGMTIPWVVSGDGVEIIVVSSHWERQGVLVGVLVEAGCVFRILNTESGAAWVTAQGSQIRLHCEGSDSKHGTILKGQRGDREYKHVGARQANELE